MLTVIGIALIIIGAILQAVFAGVPLADIISFACVMFGAGLACADYWKKQKKETPNWVKILSVALIGIGAFILGFIGQIAEEQMTLIITSVVSIAIIIAGLLTPKIQQWIAEKEAKKEKKK